MEIKISFNSGAENLLLPVLPDQLEIKTGLANSTFDVTGLGEVGIIGNRKLYTISITSFFPADYAPYCQYKDIPEPRTAIGMIEKWRDSKKPIRLTITGTPMDINMPCMIEEFSYREKGGQPGDIYYDLSLKEYRFIKPRVIKQEATVAGAQQLTVASKRPDERTIPGIYTVKKGGQSLYHRQEILWGRLKMERDL